MPILGDSDTEALKTWVTKRLEVISDADSDVLADYVLALVGSDESEEAAKPTAVDSLQDFLQEKSEGFVEEVFAAIRERKFEVGWVPKPAGAGGVAPAASGMGAGAGVKRGFEEDATSQQQVPGQQLPGFGQAENRPMKQARRGRGGGLDARGGRGGVVPQQPQHQSMQQFQNFMPPTGPAAGMPQMGNMPRMPTPPQGMPPFDPNNPAAMLAALQAMGMPMPPAGAGGSPFQNGNAYNAPPQGNGFNAPRKTGKRCRDYDQKGYCTFGATCKYDHDDTPLDANGHSEYDPSNPNAAFFNGPQPDRSGSVNMHSSNNRSERGRGGMRGRGRGRGGRSEFSSTGMNQDRSITSLVVEQIPEDKFSEEAVREFFSQFGQIEEVTMQEWKKLAIVKFSDYEEAKAAYQSPKVVFDNRFVKVYWYKPERDATKPTNGQAAGEDTEMSNYQDTQEAAIDPTELARRQEEAQKKHEEQQSKREAAAKQKEELDAKMKAMNEERAKMAAMLAKKSGKASASPAPATTTSDIPTPKPNESESTRALREKLAALEQEASSAGLDPATFYTSSSNQDPNSPQTHSHQAYDPSGFRGRGRGRGRARGTPDYGHAPSYRGGRAGFGGAVKRLDNRPKALAVIFPAPEHSYTSAAEALRQFVFLGDGLDEGTVLPHPEREDAAVVGYTERYLAERFLLALKGGKGGVLEGVGKCEVEWFTGTLPAVEASAGGGAEGSTVGKVGVEAANDGNVVMDLEADVDAEQERERQKQVYGEDVAEEDDRW
ncbi:hypothetical protein MBLNU230_g5025t1 [Neophaeotheca triangularis]